MPVSFAIVRRSSLALALVVLSVRLVVAGPTYDDPKRTDADFPYQGEYLGEIEHEGQRTTVGVQIIALGHGQFHGVGYIGGLPGAGWDRSEKREGDGQLKDGVVTFSSPDAQGFTGQIKDGALTIVSPEGSPLAVFRKIERQSPTLGAKPPQEAVVLFDGTSTDAFESGQITEDGLLKPGVTSKQRFGACQVHVEFRTPYQPEDRGQARGNSGVYLQGRYEVQVLDSFGLEGQDNECGGIYTIHAPAVNMCLPPLTWQTYDIDYAPAAYADSQKVKNATITVHHNGVLVQENVELSKATTAAPRREGADRGPLNLQDHGNPVRYRNVWIVEK